MVFSEERRRDLGGGEKGRGRHASKENQGRHPSQCTSSKRGGKIPERGQRQSEEDWEGVNHAKVEWRGGEEKKAKGK